MGEGASDELLGVLAVAGAFLSFGSFAVPIKSPSVVAAHVDPLVFQSFKTLMVFSTSWLVLLYTPLELTVWGVYGALLWVPAGLFAVMAVRLAGVGIAQGLWSGLSVVVSFAWGAFVFGNPVKDWALACVALAMIIVGIVGLTWASTSAPPIAHSAAAAATAASDAEATAQGTNVAKAPESAESDALLAEATSFGAADRTRDASQEAAGCLDQPTLAQAGSQAALDSATARRNKLGILCAIGVGFCGGTMYVPVHYAGKAAHGAQYLVSFGLGAVAVNSVALLVYFLACYVRGGYSAAAVPSFQLNVTLLPGCLTGFLWALGNWCSLNATLYLGQAVGGTAIQGQLVVAGLWSLFYYREVVDTTRRVAWFVSAGITIGGVILLVIYG